MIPSLPRFYHVSQTVVGTGGALHGCSSPARSPPLGSRLWRRVADPPACCPAGDCAPSRPLHHRHAQERRPKSRQAAE